MCCEINSLSVNRESKWECRCASPQRFKPLLYLFLAEGPLQSAKFMRFANLAWIRQFQEDRIDTVTTRKQSHSENRRWVEGAVFQSLSLKKSVKLL